MRIINILTLITLLLDALALFSFFSANVPLLTFLGLHAIACITGISYLNNQICSHYQGRKRLIILYLTLIFFIPFLGFIGAVFLNVWLTYIIRRFNPHTIKTMRIRHVQKSLTSRFAIGGLYYNLKQTATSRDSKLNVLHEAMNLAPQKINKIIRTLLTDNNDEVRLLSFQLLNAQEEKIIHAINTSLTKLNHETHPQKQFFLEKELAFEHWEFLYQGLTESTLAPLITEKGYDYTIAALEKKPNDTSLLYLAGRLSFVKKDYESAKLFFKRYLEANGLAERLTSYLVEIAYHKKEFKVIRDILSQTTPKSNIYISYAFYQFWKPAHA